MNLKEKLQQNEIKTARYSDFPHSQLSIFKDSLKDVKQAVLEDIEDLQNLIHSITYEDDIFNIRKKLNLHMKFKKKRFGDFEK